MVLAKPHLVRATTALSWAGHSVAAQLAVGDVSPLPLMQLRWLFCFLILLTIFCEEMASHWPGVKKRWRYVVLINGGLMICLWRSLTSHFGHVEVSYRRTTAGMSVR